MANKDEILMNFQAITGMEDIGMSLDILEQKGWDLEAALANVMPQEDYSQFSSGPPTNNSSSNGAVRSVGYVDLTVPDHPVHVDQEVVEVEEEEEGLVEVMVERSSNSSIHQEGSASVCILGVYFGEKLLRLELPLHTTLAELKNQLGNRTGVPPAEQVLSGWPETVRVPKELEDQMTLEQFNITGDIYHIRMDHQTPTDFLSLSRPHTLSGAVLVEHDYMNKRTFASSLITHRASCKSPVQETTLSDVRSMSVDPGSLDGRLSSHDSSEGLVVDGIKRKRGEYSGGTSEMVIMAGAGGGGVSSGGIRAKAVTLNDEDVIEVGHDGSQSSQESGSVVLDEYDGDDNTLFIDDMESCSTIKAMRDPLIPKDCTEPYEVLQYFTHSFETRYGAMHPLFLLGSLSDVVSEANSGNRKPILVYLHHDGSVLSNVFCSQLLCSESVVDYLSLNFISWAWDLTHHIHRIKLLKMVEECFGVLAKSSVDEIRADSLPVILIAYKEKGSLGIKNIIQGHTNLDSLMSSLIITVEQHNLVIEREQIEERNRLAREYMIAEQNKAFQESLHTDREKERKKKELEDEEEMERQTKEAELEAMTMSVPEEPPEDSSEKMCTLKIRFPGGEMEQRRFLALHTLKDVISFIGSKNFMVSDYKILTSFPRKDLTVQDFNLTLEDLKLCPQETVFVEERT